MGGSRNRSPAQRLRDELLARPRKTRSDSPAWRNRGLLFSEAELLRKARTMNPVGYLAVGERGFRAIFLAEAEPRAIEEAAKHHDGHTKAVVLEEGVVELVRQAYLRGLAEGRQLPKEPTA
jgi:hypothetical protein